MIDWSNLAFQELVRILPETLQKNDVKAVLVSGGCVTIYSRNRYHSYDFNFVTDDAVNKAKKVLRELGFIEKQQYFQRKDCIWFIEVVSPYIAIVNESISPFNPPPPSFGGMKLICPIDRAKEPLAHFYYWLYHQALEQAASNILTSYA